MTRDTLKTGETITLEQRDQNARPRRPAWAVYVDGVCQIETDSFGTAADFYNGMLTKSFRAA